MHINIASLQNCVQPQYETDKKNDHPELSNTLDYDQIVLSRVLKNLSNTTPNKVRAVIEADDGGGDKNIGASKDGLQIHILLIWKAVDKAVKSRKAYHT